jgi:hypothetical protein
MGSVEESPLQDIAPAFVWNDSEKKNTIYYRYLDPDLK